MSSNQVHKENEENYIFDVPSDYEPDPRGLGHHFFENMKKHRNRVAQYVVETDEEDTYEELLTRCVRTALHLKSRNLTKHDVIGLCSYIQKDSLVPFVASLFVGVPVASWDPILSLMDVTHLMKEVKPKVLFVAPESLEIIENALKNVDIEAEIIVLGHSDVHTEFSTFLEPHVDEETFIPKAVDDIQDTAVIFFSSGTTGLPKGIMVNHYALLLHGYNIIRSGLIGPVYLSYASLYWISTVIFQVASVQVGGAKIIDRQFHPTNIWHVIDKYKVTHVFCPPSSAIDMMKAGRPIGIDTSSLSNLIVAGAAIPEKLLNAVRELLPGTFVFQAYGQTEVGGVISTFNVTETKDTQWLTSKPNSVGLIFPGLKAKVVNPDTETICGPNQRGELRIQSKGLMNGYYNRDSSESYDKDGWLRTGDIVYFDDDKCFYVVDRIKEMLKYKSWHVVPAAVEQIILTHPNVSQAVVIGIPHDEDGDHPMALIILTEGSAGKVTEEEIKAFVDERAPDRMRLRGGVKFVDSVPITPTGKVQRNKLKNMVINGEI